MRSRRRSAPYSGASCSSSITPCATVCACASSPPAPQLRSSSSITVDFLPTKYCLSARICRRKRSAFCASRRSSDSESSTTRVGADALDLVEQHLRHLVQLDFRRVEQRVLLGRAVLLGGGELEDVDAVEGPAVRARDGAQLVLRLGERDEQDLLAALDAFEQELQRERGLAGAGVALDEVEPVGRQPAAEDVVQSRDARAEAGRRRGRD